MKYGIITYTSAQNWGGMLQAYALFSYIRKMGIDCELINYREFDSRLFKPRKSIEDIIYSLLKVRENIRRVNRYISFRELYLGLREPVISDYAEMKSLNSKYDAFITGSDQLWNCETKINYDFYLNFTDDEKVRLSYGPSFGQEKIPCQFESKVSDLLKRYDLMSVREESGRKIVAKLINKDIPVVCDPAFLLTEKEWEVVSNKSINENNYIFIYPTQVSRQVIELTKKYHELFPDKKIISAYAIPEVKVNVRKDIGPAEFLSYIREADYVIGTSFHAVVFSLIYKRNFAVIPHSSTGARVVDLLKLLGLESHIISNDIPNEFPMIKTDTYMPKLNRLITESKNYIDYMLEYRK